MELLSSAIHLSRAFTLSLILGFSSFSIAANHGYELSSGDSLVLTGAAAELSNLSTFTIEFWAKTSGNTLPFNLVQFGNAGGITSLGSVLNNQLAVDLSGTSFTTRTSTTSFGSGSWQHLAVTFNAGTWNFYLNGALLDSITDSSGNTVIPNWSLLGHNDLIFGISSLTLDLLNPLGSISSYIGHLDDIRLWNIARSVSDINANRSLELNGDEVGLLGYWKLNELTGTTVTDSSSIGSLDGVSSGVTLQVDGAFSKPEFFDLDGDSVSWAGVGNFVTLDENSNATLIDLDLDLLNGGLGNYDDVTLTVARQGGAWSADEFIIADGTGFTVNGNNLQTSPGALNFASFTNSNGELEIIFDDTSTVPTTALLNEVISSIRYRNDTPAGDALIRLSLDDGIELGVADVTVVADVIYLTSASDNSVIDLLDGVSFRESIAMVNADATGLLTLIVDSSLNGDTLNIDTAVDVELLHNLSLNLDLVPDITINLGVLNLEVNVDLTILNGTNDTATLDVTLTGVGRLLKDGLGTLVLTGSHTLTGLTHVIDGVLELTGSLVGALLIDGDLLSDGHIDGLVTVRSGGNLGVADAPGSLELDGGLNLQSGSLLTLQLDGTTAETGHDQLVINNSLTLAGSLNIIGSHVGVTSDSVTLINNIASDAVTGTFNSLSQNSSLLLNSIPYVISYLDGDGNDVSLRVLPPTVSANNISTSGATGLSSTFRVGDTIQVEWDNSTNGDNNDNIAQVEIDFSNFGGGSSVAATVSSGIWSASFNISSGSIDATNIEVSVTATTDQDIEQTTADNNILSLDNLVPSLSDSNISTSGASGNSGVYIIGDTLVAQWNNSSSGDNNVDITSASFDFSEFGGGSAVAATNVSDTWTAQYDITESSISGSNLNISVTTTDDAGNSSTNNDTSNSSVDALKPSGHTVSFNNSLYDSTNNSSASFSLLDAEIGTNYSYSVTSTGGGTAITGSASNISSSSISVPIDLTNLNDGELNLTLILTDDAGNSAEVTNMAQLEVNVTDSDGDGVSDGQEAVDNTDPNDAADYVDNVAPTLTAPSSISINATGLYTEITLRQLLGLSANSSESLLSSTLQATASDNLNDCCTIEALQLNDGTKTLQSGGYTIDWRATDGKGNSTQETQSIEVLPQLSFGQNSFGAEGETVNIKVLLSGLSPTYPLQVNYTIATSSTADGADYDLTPENSVTFNINETETMIEVDIQGDSISDNNETLVFEFDSSVNTGTQNSHTLTIVESNLAPQMSLELHQSGERTTLVTTDSPITITSNATDPNSADNSALTYDWSSTDSALVETDGNVNDAALTFDPTNLSSGLYKVALRVTDPSGASTSGKLYFIVIDSAPTHSTNDTDGDGIDDATEGSEDTDGDGIPDYLDNIDATNLLPAVASETNRYLLECNPGLLFRLGQYALQGDNGGARLEPDELSDIDRIYLDTNASSSNDTFDFEVHELAIEGQSAQIILPLSTPLTTDSQYRSFINGQWVVFIENTYNQIYSAPGGSGYCPSPGDNQWQPGLATGDECIQLTIEDGGPNDADDESNSTILNTGTINYTTPSVSQNEQETSEQRVSFTSGGSSRGGAGSLYFFTFLILCWVRYKNKELNVER